MMSTGAKFLAFSRIAVMILVAGLLGVGCMPITITKTIKISRSTDLFQAEPGSAIPDDYTVPDFSICDWIPEQYRDVTGLIGGLLQDNHLGFLANLIHIDGLDLVDIQFKIVEGGGSFDGVTEVSASLNGDPVLLATPGSGISPTEIVVTPDDPIDLLGLLEDCPTVSAAIRGTVPDPPPTEWDNYLTLRLRAYLGFRPASG